MTAAAALTTAKAPAAIASIQLAGDSAKAILQEIFISYGGVEISFKTGELLVGTIVDIDKTIDHVVVGCCGSNDFTINCHGNPIIIEIIMELLQKHGAELVDTEQMLANKFALTCPDAICAEAKLAQLKAQTLQGIKVIAAQTKAGLVNTARTWLDNFDKLNLEDIKKQVCEILNNSKAADIMINGANIVIAGPPNSGKSTLLNCLAGSDRAIVTPIAGTTTDHVGSLCRLGSIIADIIDTAGLDKTIADSNSIHYESQKITLQLINKSDLILFVLDGSKKISTILTDIKTKVPVITILNKSDLGVVGNEKDLTVGFADSVRISAKHGDGIKDLIAKIQQVLGINTLDPVGPICFTPRQYNLLNQILTVKTKSHVKSIITELLKIQTNV